MSIGPKHAPSTFSLYDGRYIPIQDDPPSPFPIFGFIFFLPHYRWEHIYTMRWIWWVRKYFLFCEFISLMNFDPQNNCVWSLANFFLKLGAELKWNFLFLPFPSPLSSFRLDTFSSYSSLFLKFRYPPIPLDTFCSCLADLALAMKGDNNAMRRTIFWRLI